MGRSIRAASEKVHTESSKPTVNERDVMAMAVAGNVSNIVSMLFISLTILGQGRVCTAHHG